MSTKQVTIRIPILLKKAMGIFRSFVEKYEAGARLKDLQGKSFPSNYHSLSFAQRKQDTQICILEV